MPRLNLIWLINIVFVIIEVESLNCGIMFILLKISLVILKYYLLFHLWIIVIRLLHVMLSTIERPSLMNISLVSLMSHWNLLILILVVKLIRWDMHVDIVDILLLHHFCLFGHLLLLLIHSHLVLQLLLLLMELLLLLMVLEILLSHGRLGLHLWVLLAIVI